MPAHGDTVRCSGAPGPPMFTANGLEGTRETRPAVDERFRILLSTPSRLAVRPLRLQLDKLILPVRELISVKTIKTAPIAERVTVTLDRSKRHFRLEGR